MKVVTSLPSSQLKTDVMVFVESIVCHSNYLPQQNHSMISLCMFAYRLFKCHITQSQLSRFQRFFASCLLKDGTIDMERNTSCRIRCYDLVASSSSNRNSIKEIKVEIVRCIVDKWSSSGCRRRYSPVQEAETWKGCVVTREPLSHPYLLFL